MRSIRTQWIETALAIVLIARLGESAEGQAEANWVDISSPIVQKVTRAGQKAAWPGEPAGVAVDPASGNVYMIVTGQGIWKSTDMGSTFVRVDGGKVGGLTASPNSPWVAQQARNLAMHVGDLPVKPMVLTRSHRSTSGRAPRTTLLETTLVNRERARIFWLVNSPSRSC